mgnify:CR=1 FL=1
MRNNKLLISLMIAGLVMTAIPMNLKAEGKINSSGEEKKIFSIASVSKMYAVTAVMQLVDDGKVDIDAPVTDYITDFRLADERYKDITVRMLMNHTSGLMGSVVTDSVRYDEKSTDYNENFLEVLSKERLKAAPGEYNCYCNDGFTLLEILVERVSGMSFTEYMEENISLPLGLDNTGSMWNMETSNLARYYMNGNIRMAADVCQTIGAGGIMTDVEELCTFGSAFFEGNNVLLSEEAKNMMAENQVTGLSTECYGLGWDEVAISDYEAAGVKVVQKGGDLYSHHSSLVVAPEEEISVVVLSSGGSSSINGELAQELLDIALEEKGISVEHPKHEVTELSENMPDNIHTFSGQYMTSGGLIDISFSDKGYFTLRKLNDTEKKVEQYIYTVDGSFIKVSGDIESGNAIPAKPVQELYFETVAGRDFIRTADGYIVGERLKENPVSESYQKAWDERNGVNYYLVNCKYNDMAYLTNPEYTINTSEDVRGYMNNLAIIDENHARNLNNMPSSSSRDIFDIEIIKKDGYEILNCIDSNMSLISESSIPDFSRDITEVVTTSGNAKWYRLNGVENETVRLDIPENAAVYVYDKFGRVKYSRYMLDYGNCVPLPEYGMIVFIGDTGAKIGIGR